ncbi:metallopeptidase family protein [Adlercreutzia shanghongiae]|uniref:Metallopeptidase family protein n=1 Tax=Adlercreutzia shanghongiae TaxID=3111773 RepID=A0ABU6IZ60_9ACTN|nr:metallopeptidase family protein [Adlercreutzia sp. R22]MEC4295125.1 metallopeptidase family protein [Adlercreutzia sp. R22]
MYRMTDEEFETAIEEALDAMPEQFLEALQNIAIVWEEEPNAYHLGYDEDEWEEPSEERARCEGDSSEATDEGYEPLPDDLLGLFDGLSLVERADGYDDDIPDVITVFKGPHERCFESREEIVEEIGKTIIHELGHYFGLDEDQLAAMGYE